ncbi:Hypothetical protein C900_05739 [Fulvivirga imtechensis AK7]|uniref:Rho termination factor-like N-terminal domain-containing protein n=2 Tax=Fulvivirga TaxID=396811 RepID=L8JZL2_9BACT|nr:Hypothetical protein C900_05739 [Fulvivirga imtechensis AK7]
MAKGDNKGGEKYNMFKEFEGSRYSGMKIGASHKWYYDRGEWRERKVTPENWDIYYETTKNRAGKAPEGSGAPVGTEYNWLIVAHQRVSKLDANSYMTCLDGKKFKVAHKRAGKNRWNTKEKTQRKKVIQFLEQVIQNLKEADEDEQVPYTVGEVERIYGLEHKNKAELYEVAAERNIPNRSKMSRAELLDAITNTISQKKAEPTETKRTEQPDEKLTNKSKEALYDLAQKRRIKGRSQMKKKELVNALKERQKKTVL